MNNLFYVEIKKYLLDLIEQNKDKPDFKLPSENQLAKKFNTSRLTVKKAMNQLADKGMIYRYQGKGTFINTKRINTNPQVKDMVVCIIVPNVASKFVQAILNGVLDIFNDINVTCMIFQTQNSQVQEEKILRALTANNISGAIIFPASGNIHNKGLLWLALKNYPMVSIDRNLQDLNLDCVLTDHYEMVYNCVSQRIAEGHKKIALIHAEPQAQSSQMRVSGYMNAHIDNKITPSNDRILMLAYNHFSKFTQESNDQLTKIFSEFLENHREITSIISLNNFIAMPLIKSINLSGNKIDLTFIDDDYPELQNFIPYPYRTLLQDGYNIGKTSAKLLVEKIANPSQPTKIIRIPFIEKPLIQ